MITYYDDRSVRVTSTAIEVEGRRYPFSALTGVWQQRGERSWRAVAGRSALVAGLLAPVVAAGLGIALALRSDIPSETVITVGVFCLVAGVTIGPFADLLLERMERSYDSGLRDLQLWVEVAGRPVMLLQTRDARRFGQICRAVQRALEAHGHPRWPLDSADAGH